MKSIYLFILVFVVLISGCKTSSPFKAGLYTTTAARIGFDSEEDRELFREIKERVDAFLATDQLLTEALVNSFVAEYADRVSPAVIFLVVEDINQRLRTGEHAEDAREFLQGVSAALEGV